MEQATTARAGTAWARLFSAGQWLIDALYPRRCLGCGRYGSWCCVACLASVQFPRQQHCPACAEVSALGAFCPDCASTHTLNGLWTAVPYGNPLVRELVRALKYEGLTEVAPVLAQLTAAVLTAYSLPPAWHAIPREQWFLTPVPLAPRRERRRGFNQSRLLTELISRAANLPLVHVLKRTRETRAQAELKPELRLGNLTAAFSLYAEAAVAGNAYVLVDDVYTSGATLEECAKVLKSAGAAEVWGLTVAYG